MPNKRPIPKVDIQDYVEQGVLYFKPHPPNVVIEMHYCSAFLSEAEALESILCFIKAGKEVWGEDFMDTVLAHVERL